MADPTPAGMTAEQYGPREEIRRRCFDCKACVGESYTCQSDSGTDVYCEHPSLPARKKIGDTNWDTPDWCPVLAARLSGMAAVRGPALTNAQIIEIAIATRSAEPGRDGYILPISFARAILSSAPEVPGHV